MDLIELNEAFATQSMVVIKELGINTEILNVNGGAIALGHPLGATGIRVIINQLIEFGQDKDAKYSIGGICAGGGVGGAFVLERA